MRTLRTHRTNPWLPIVFALSACGDEGDGDKQPEPEVDASSPVTVEEDAGSAGSMDAGPRDPFADLINGFLGDGGLSGITSLLGDGGLAGLTGLFDGGLSGFFDGGFDPAVVCARAPQFCPDAGAGPRDAGADAGDAGGDASAPDAGEPDAEGPSPDASSAVDASDPGADTGA